MLPWYLAIKVSCLKPVRVTPTTTMGTMIAVDQATIHRTTLLCPRLIFRAKGSLSDVVYLVSHIVKG